MVRVLSSVCAAVLIAGAGSALLTAASAPTPLYYALGLALTALATSQSLFPGSGLRWSVGSIVTRRAGSPQERLPDDSEHDAVALRRINGSFVQAGSPTEPFSWPPAVGRFDEPARAQVLYASSTAEAAAAEAIAGMRRASEGARIEVVRRITTLRVEGLDVIDLTDPATLTQLGASVSDFHSYDRLVTRPLAELAHRAGAKGMLAESRFAPGELTLVVYPDAFDRVTILNADVATIVLPDAISDPVVRERLSQDESLLRAFVEALESEQFDDWLGSLDLTEDEIARLHSSADPLRS